MWLCFNDAFLSIVKKDCRDDQLLVRARRKGDIERVFPNAHVTRYTKSDYLYRARVDKLEVINALASRVQAVDYPDFKDSVKEDDLHDAYVGVWGCMARTQEVPPYSGFDDVKRR